LELELLDPVDWLGELDWPEPDAVEPVDGLVLLLPPEVGVLEFVLDTGLPLGVVTLTEEVRSLLLPAPSTASTR